MSRGPQDKGCSMSTSHWLRDLTSPWRLSQKPGQDRRKARGEGGVLAHRQPSHQPSSERSTGPGFQTSPFQWIQFQVWGASHPEILLDAHSTPALWEVTEPMCPLRTLGDVAQPHLQY